MVKFLFSIVACVVLVFVGLKIADFTKEEPPVMLDSKQVEAFALGEAMAYIIDHFEVNSKELSKITEMSLSTSAGRYTYSLKSKQLQAPNRDWDPRGYAVREELNESKAVVGRLLGEQIPAESDMDSTLRKVRPIMEKIADVTMPHEMHALLIGLEYGMDANHREVQAKYAEYLISGLRRSHAWEAPAKLVDSCVTVATVEHIESEVVTESDPHSVAVLASGRAQLKRCETFVYARHAKP